MDDYNTNILGVNVYSGSIESLLASIELALAGKGKAKVLTCINAHSIVLASRDKEFKDAFLNSDFVLPDGLGIILSSAILSKKIKRKIAGMDIFLALSEKLNREKGSSYFFLGSSEETLRGIKEQISKHFPNIRLAGMISPPFRPMTPEEVKMIIEEINNSHPTVLWVGLTAPKQEKWAVSNRNLLNLPLVACVGGVFDYFSLVRRRAPKLLITLGLEWFWRLMIEPGRMWKRTFISVPRLITLIFAEKVNNCIKRDE